MIGSARVGNVAAVLDAQPAEECVPVQRQRAVARRRCRRAKPYSEWHAEIVLNIVGPGYKECVVVGAKSDE